MSRRSRIVELGRSFCKSCFRCVFDVALNGEFVANYPLVCRPISCCFMTKESIDGFVCCKVFGTDEAATSPPDSRQTQHLARCFFFILDALFTISKLHLLQFANFSLKWDHTGYFFEACQLSQTSFWNTGKAEDGTLLWNEQAGTGPSRRHIQGSKIVKRLPSVKYSLLQYSKIEIFWKKIFEKITYSKKWTEWRAKVSQCRKTEREDPLRFFNIHSVAKHEKIENKNFHFLEKISQCQKTERGDPLGFFNIHSVAKHQKKCRGDPLGKNFFRKKSLAVPKKMKGGSLWSRPVWYVTRKNRKNLFWFSSLDQIVQFGAIIFCRTFVELFWSVRVDRKKSHYNSRVSLHEAPTKNFAKKIAVPKNQRYHLTCQGFANEHN